MLHRSKRSRSREPESDRSKRSRHARSHQSRDRASPEAAPARQHTAEEDRQGSAANATSGSLPFSKAPSQPKGLVVVKAKQFDGCYSQLVDKLLDTQPRQVWHAQNQQISAKSRVLLQCRLLACDTALVWYPSMQVLPHGVPIAAWSQAAASVLSQGSVICVCARLTPHEGNLCCYAICHCVLLRLWTHYMAACALSWLVKQPRH